jgi:hypothetical protein
MRTLLACLAGALAFCACRTSLGGAIVDASSAPVLPSTSVAATEAPPRPVSELGPGASPGNARGPGGFVPRGSMRNFYAGAGGRLWYYLNNYYWVPEAVPREDLWIKAEVVEEFRDLRTWPDGAAVAGPAPKTTVEYWEVGPSGRTVWVDNHKDYCLLKDGYSAGAITVEVTLTLGRLQVKDERDAWGDPEEPYVLESRNYRGGGGIGAARARFRALPTEAVTVWAYAVPWSTHPQRLTRSNWKRLVVPEWELKARRSPAAAAEGARETGPP